jgi:hypothetical protein
MLSYSNLKYSDNAIYMPLFQLPHTINQLHIPDFLKMKIQKSLGEFVKYAYRVYVYFRIQT